MFLTPELLDHKLLELLPDLLVCHSELGISWPNCPKSRNSLWRKLSGGHIGVILEKLRTPAAALLYFLKTD